MATAHNTLTQSGTEKCHRQGSDKRSDNTRTPRGFPIKICLHPSHMKFLCEICKLLLRVPYQSFCGHRFCYDCLNYFLKTKKPCPVCIQEKLKSEYSDLKRTFPDNALKKEMDKLEVKCYIDECPWKGRLAYYSKHIRQCSLANVKCKCGSIIFCEEMEDHTNTECKYRNIKCVFGCDELIPGETIRYHNKNNLALHLDRLYEQVRTMEENGTQIDGTKDHEYMSRLEQRLDNVDSIIKAKETVIEQNIAHSAQTDINKSTTQEEREPNISKLSSDISHIELSMEGLQSGICEGQLKLSDEVKTQTNERASYEKFQTKLRNIERSMALKDVAILEHGTRIESIEKTTYDGTYIWHVKHWSKLLRDSRSGHSVSIYSAPFYSSRNGYKFCGRLYPNGDGMGRETHISLFFVVMRSNYDAILRWPFRAKITFTLLDLTQSNDNIVEAFRTDPTSSSFTRPTSDMNIASGCPKFVAHALFERSSQYVKNDEFFVKIKVELQE